MHVATAQTGAKSVAGQPRLRLRSRPGRSTPLKRSGQKNYVAIREIGRLWSSGNHRKNYMKFKMFAGAAIAALMTAGAAHAQSGHVGVGFQTADAGGGSEVDSTAVDGAFLFTDNFQVNAAYASLEGDADAWGIDAFLFNRSETGAFGGFIGYQSLDLGGSSTADGWNIGLLGQMYSGNTTWSGQLGYADTESDISILHLDGEARHFFSDNFSAQANLGFGNIDISGGGDGDFWSGGVGAEWQFTGAPISIYGGWQHVDFDGGDVDTLGAGVRWNFGGGTLLERNRSGASYRRAVPSFFELLVGGGNSNYTPR
jgi:hypothetical protein